MPEVAWESQDSRISSASPEHCKLPSFDPQCTAEIDPLKLAAQAIEGFSIVPPGSATWKLGTSVLTCGLFLQLGSGGQHANVVAHRKGDGAYGSVLSFCNCCVCLELGVFGPSF